MPALVLTYQTFGPGLRDYLNHRVDTLDAHLIHIPLRLQIWNFLLAFFTPFITSESVVIVLLSLPGQLFLIDLTHNISLDRLPTHLSHTFAASGSLWDSSLPDATSLVRWSSTSLSRKEQASRWNKSKRCGKTSQHLLGNLLLGVGSSSLSSFCFISFFHASFTGPLHMVLTNDHCVLPTLPMLFLNSPSGLCSST